LGLKILTSNIKTLNFPYKLIFAVTYKCNSKCKTCKIWKKEVKNELTLDELQNFFSKNKFPWINLTGGEVFLREDLVEIVEAIRGTYLLNITTNGILTDKIIKDSIKIRDIIPKYILTFSIDGTKKLHNTLRGVKCWEKAIDTYKKAKDVGIQSYIGVTISPHNIKYFDDTLNEIKKTIPDFTTKNLHVNFYHESELYYENKDELNLDEKYIKNVVEIIDKLKKSKTGFGLISNLEKKYIKLYEKYINSRITPLPCKAPSASCFLDPQGNVYPCTFMKNNLGNIRKSGYNLKRIYNSKKIDEIMKEIKNNNCPGCWTPCEAYQSILGNLIK
jgi:MoaA/NifB/PqqE/SkfB family radical SAM enzyme